MPTFSLFALCLSKVFDFLFFHNCQQATFFLKKCSKNFPKPVFPAARGLNPSLLEKLYFGLTSKTKLERRNIALITLILTFSLHTHAQNTPTTAQIYKTQADSLAKLKDYPASSELYQKAADVYQALENWGEWRRCVYRVSVNLKKQKRYPEAVEVLESAIVITKKLGEKGDTIEAKLLMGIAITHAAAGKFLKAGTTYDKALSIFEKHQIENTLVAGLYKNSGNIYTRQGNYPQALDRLKRALGIYLKFDKHNKAAQVHNDIGIVYNDLEQLLTAISHFEKALDLMSSDNSLKGAVWVNMGATQLALLAFEKALDYNQKALDFFTVKYGENHPNVSACYKALGTVYLEMGDAKKATIFLKKSLEIALVTYGDKHRETAKIYMDMGKLANTQQQYTAALTHFQHALIALVPSFSDTAFVKNPSEKQLVPEPWIFFALQAKANAFFQLFLKNEHADYVHTTLANYELATAQIDLLRQAYSSETAKMELAGRVRKLYDEAIAACLKLAKRDTENGGRFLEKAFYFSEKKRAAVLLEAMTNTQAKLFANIPDSLLHYEQELNEEVAELEKTLFEAQEQTIDSKAIANLESQIFDLKRNREKLIAQLETDFPEYYQLKYNIEVASVAQVQQELTDANTAFIEYFIGDSSIYIFVITDSDFEVFTVAKTTHFNQHIQDLRRSLTDNHFVQENKAEAYQLLTKSSHELYKITLSQALQSFKNKVITNLSIVPDGWLGAVPFEVLLKEVLDDETADFRRLLPHYVIHDFQINYGYSATMLCQQTQQKTNTKRKLFAGFAPTYETSKLEASGDSLIYNLSRGGRGGFAELKGAKAEVEAISTLLNGEAFYGGDANKSHFLDIANTYHILHLSMHGVINEANPLYSKLLFAQTTENAENSYLNAYELYNRRLDADLAVLSACHTGEGQLVEGEGILSLSRAFTYAGCPSIVMSLWKANDVATKDIMVAFYESLRQHKSKDAALQQAKLTFLENTDRITAHPHYWATFVQIGSATPIDFGHKNGYFKWLGLLGVFVIGWLGFRLGKK